MLDVCLLGTGGMMPLPNRWLTSLMLRHNGSNMLIDCGEGTQISIRQKGWSFKPIDVICFTHYHGDHIGGLPGLLLTIGNSDRREPITLIGPKGLERVVKGLRVIAPELPFALDFIELHEQYHTLQVKGYTLEAYKLNHNVTCYGYNVNINRQGKFLVEKAKALGLPVQYWNTLQKGGTVTYQDKEYQPDAVLGAPRKGIKLSYCTDTRPVKNIEMHAKDADLFICEGMYADEEKENRANEYKHMTFEEAASLASKAHVKELWLTHFSPSLVRPKDYVHVAQKYFENTKVGKDRMSTTLKFEE
ncbi:ribonuclease Z [Vallitalea pronyensis]|uniref:Ribonuclease Z n=1 Tax=Vallitalea pronyensis TaxID=1348613 RepID=A0A8J8SIS5_9FIRM|nr:ribonuclease Z [Vallitalea pronyensis]QUI24911.1 ribonuclease Z [Vallitalea pronyensis]